MSTGTAVAIERLRACNISHNSKHVGTTNTLEEAVREAKKILRANRTSKPLVVITPKF